MVLLQAGTGWDGVLPRACPPPPLPTIRPYRGYSRLGICITPRAQEYLAHERLPPPLGPRTAVGPTVLLWGPMGALFLISEVPL